MFLEAKDLADNVRVINVDAIDCITQWTSDELDHFTISLRGGTEVRLPKQDYWTVMATLAGTARI